MGIKSPEKFNQMLILFINYLLWFCELSGNIGPVGNVVAAIDVVPVSNCGVLWPEENKY